MATNVKTTLSNSDLLDLICYNLAQFSYLMQNYYHTQQITDYQEFVDIVARRIQIDAQNRLNIIKNLNHLKNRTRDTQQIKFYDEEIKKFSLVPYNLFQVANNKSSAKHYIRYLFLLENFEIVIADQKTTARPYDSLGKTGLLGPQSTLFKQLYTHYNEIHSVGPFMDTYAPSIGACQDRVEVLLSLAKPDKKTYHQIWINDHLMLKAQFKTNESLNAYLYQNEDLIHGVLQLIAYAESIEKKAKGHLTQSFIDQEIKMLRMDHLKRQGEHFLEQYSILTVELLGQLIKNLTAHKKQALTSSLFDRVNHIAGLQQPFSHADISKMKMYLNIRDSLAHPSEYNLRPLGNSTQSKNKQNLLANFVQDISKYLCNILNIKPSDLSHKINAIPRDDTYDVRGLILLMDTRKSFRDLCIKHGNLNPKQQDVFLHLGFINSAENDILKDAVQLRNTLCHSKINREIAKEAENIALKSTHILNKIASCVDKKFGVGLPEYFNPQRVVKTSTLADLQKEYSFINTDFETCPDKELFKLALKEKELATGEKFSPKLLRDLYLFAITMHATYFTHDFATHSPYDEQEILPYVQEVYNELQALKGDTTVAPKNFIFKGILKAWVNGHPIPKLKNQNTRA